MTPGFTQLSILANRDQWRRLGDNFRTGRPAIDSTDLIWIGVCIVASIVVIYVLSKATATANRNRAIHSPRKLFAELADAHGLERSQRRLLEAIARTQTLPIPAMIFLEPARLADKRLPKGLRGHQEIVALRETLFGDDAGGKDE